MNKKILIIIALHFPVYSSETKHLAIYLTTLIREVKESLEKSKLYFEPAISNFDNIESAKFSPDDSRLLIKINNSVLVHDLKRNETLLALKEYEGLNQIWWHPKGTHIATCYENGVARVWETEAGTEITKIAPQRFPLLFKTFPIRVLAWSPDGKEIALGYGTQVIICDSLNGKKNAILNGPKAQVYSILWNPEGTKLLVGSSDYPFLTESSVWDRKSVQKIAYINDDGIAHSFWDNQKAKVIIDKNPTTEDSRPVQVVNIQEPTELLNLPNCKQLSLRCALPSPDNNFIVTDHFSTICLWDCQTGTSLNQKEHGFWGHDPEWSPDEKLICTRWSENFTIFDALSAKPLATISHDGDPCYGQKFSNDGKSLITISRKSIKVWNVIRLIA